MKKSKLGSEPFILPMPALVVGANINGKPNFMIASWCGIAAYKPPAITIAMNKARYTLKGIRENGTFSVNVPSCEMIKKTDYCGIYSGRKKDKSQIFRTFYGELKTAPLIEECPIILECKSLHHLDMRTHILIVGEIIETYITSECLKDGKVDPEKIDPPVYIRPTMKYHRLDAVIEVDRYITMPGQALAYKIGQFEIERQRAGAERRQGARFSLKGFHDRLLSLGTLPLPALRRELGT